MKRIKLFDLNEVVQALIIKDTAENENPSIKITFYATIEGAYLTMGFEPEYKDEEKRDQAFVNMDEEKLKGIFNNIIDSTEFPIDKI